MDDDLPRYIAEVSAEHDRMMVKHGSNGYSNGYAVLPRGADLHYRDLDNALVAAPEPEADGFSEFQKDVLADTINQLRCAWERDIEQATEKLEQRLLQTVARLAVPGERAEETMYALKDRVARVEQFIERRLADVNSDNAAAVGAVATQRAAEVAELKAENRELKAAFRKLDRQHEETTKELAELKARVAMGSERLAEVKAETRAENEILRAQQDEITERYIQIAGQL
jgi:hypothetical protein